MSQPKRFGLPIAVALVILALNLFVLSPALTSIAGPTTANLIYMAIRMATPVGLAYALSTHFGRSRFQSITATAFVMFIDHAIFKGIFMWLDSRKNPEAWQGLNLNSAIYGVLVSYILFFPVIFLLAFLGTEIKTLFAQFKGKNQVRSF